MDHSNTDALSRLPVAAEPHDTSNIPNNLHMVELEHAPIPADEVKLHTSRDHLLQKVVEHVQNWWPNVQEEGAMDVFAKKRNELSVEIGVLVWGRRVVIPATLRMKVLEELHVGHTGMVRMKAIARAYVYWPKMDKEVESYVSACQPCMLNSNNPSSAPPHPWERSTNPWQRIHIDHAGPFMKHLFLVVVDTFSKWLEVHIVPSTSSKATISALRLMFATHGVPETIVSDNGSGFTSDECVHEEEWGAASNYRPYSPQSNGAAERAVQTVKRSLSKLAMEGGEANIEPKLLRFLFSSRCTPHSVTGVSPAELLMRCRLRSRLTTLKDTRRSLMVETDTRGTRSLCDGDLVLVRCYNPNRWVSGVIIGHEGDVMYRVRIQEGVIRRHINQIKSAPKLMCDLVGKEYDISNEASTTEPMRGETGAASGEMHPVSVPVSAGARVDIPEASPAVQPSSRRNREEGVTAQPAVEVNPPGAIPSVRMSSRRNRGQTSRYNDYVE